MPYDQEYIPKEHFKDMVKRKKVVRFPYGHGGVIHEVRKLLENNAITLEGIADKLKIERKTAYTSIAHLRTRFGLKIRRYYNPNDKKFYFLLENS